MKKVIVVGGGPAGLMAAEVLSQAGVSVHVYDAMPSVGRKFLLAGKGGLNLTHSEPLEIFCSRYGERRTTVEAMVHEFGPHEIREWAAALGVPTFVGTSGRVFPTDMKAAPLLRAWLHRLRASGVQFHMRHRWTGWLGDGSLAFESPAGDVADRADALVLALGGASWKHLGSDGAWVPLLAERGALLSPLLPANCGFDVTVPRHDAGKETRREFFKDLAGPGIAPAGWSPHFSSGFAGQPFKSVAISFTDAQGRGIARKGEFIATATGVEGSLIYAASSLLRDEIAARGSATLLLDLLPDKPADKVLSEVRHPRGSRSLSSHLKSRLGIEGIKSAILYEILGKEGMADSARLAAAIKALPITLTAARPIDEAISTAGGVRFDGMDAGLMLSAVPGVFCAGEMLDWEAPTGGYLLTACFATGRAAAKGALQALQA
ncbi:TIGR03862 family flavoprotein [soil metagenome]